jgi:hypothetical protein
VKPIGVISTTALVLLLGITAPAVARQDQQEKPQKQEEKAKPAKQEKQAKPEKQQQAQAPKQQQQAKGQQDQQQKQREKQDKSAKQEQQQQAKGQQDQQRQQREQQTIVQHDQQQQQAKSAKQEHVQQVKDQQDQQRQQQANRPSQQEQHGQRGQQQAVWQEHRAHNWQSEHRDWRQRGGYNGYRIPDDRYRGNFGPDHAFRIYSYPVEVYGGYPRFQYGGFWFGLMDPWPEYWSDDWYDTDDVYIDYSGDGYYMYNRRYPRDRIAITVYVN